MVLLLMTVGRWVGLNDTTFTPDITKRKPKVLKFKELPQKWSPRMPNVSLFQKESPLKKKRVHQFGCSNIQSLDDMIVSKILVTYVTAKFH